MKKCTTCKVEKELTEFHKKKESKDGLRADCKSCKKEYDKEHYQTNKERVKERIKEYNQANKEYYKEYQQTYKERRNKLRRDRKKADPLYKMTHNLRSRTYKAFKNNGYTKNTKTKEMLGVDWEVCKAHIERQFTKGMSWDNQGDWHIDHIIPLASANTEQELKKLCHYSNLQPLWAVDNIIKSAKINGQQNRFRF